METGKKLEWFSELMLCDGIYSWTFDHKGELLDSNCPDQEVLLTAFELFGGLDEMIRRSGAMNTPAILSTDFGLVWGADYQMTEKMEIRCHLIGPVLYNDADFEAVYQNLRNKGLKGVSIAWINQFRQVFGHIPACQHLIFSRNLKMLHYCISGNNIDVSDIFIPQIAMPNAGAAKAGKDRQRVYRAEKAMLEMVRQGNLNYKEALGNSLMVSNGVGVTTKDPLRNSTVSTIVFCSIVCRAAMEGGMNPEEAYSLGDAYIQSALDARTISENSSICMTMYDDFIRRVHRNKQNPKYSHAIQKCCDYIQMHIEQDLHAEQLADLAGYSVTYFTRRFRQETGQGISDYVKNTRIEMAKVLLDTSDASVSEIAEKLGFTTRNYFSQCFREITGMTPGKYRSRAL